MKDSLGRETDHRTPCDEGKHEENCTDETCDCNCRNPLLQAMLRLSEEMR